MNKYNIREWKFEGKEGRKNHQKGKSINRMFKKRALKKLI